MMSRDSSPLPSSDDSAVGSLSSCFTNGDSTTRVATNQTSWRNSHTTTNRDSCSQSSSSSNNISSNLTSDLSRSAIEAQSSSEPQTTVQPRAYNRTKFTRPSVKDLIVDQDELAQAAKQMRASNVSLISRSLRTVLSCFDDLDLQKFELRTNYLINFISSGINKCHNAVLRPVSILWPDTYDRMAEELSILDTFLLNTEFREKPVDWMLRRGLTTTPDCRQCKNKMTLKYENNTVRWQCQKKQACQNYFMPILRPSFFSQFENISLDKLLFSIYYWATCTPGDEIHSQMNIDAKVLYGIWTRIQNVCRTSLERSYPRLRLTNHLEQLVLPTESETIPIDLISIKLNEFFIVCAKHPKSNLVRLGLYVPNVSLYDFVDLTESWFAHGTHVRVCESKFLDLSKKRSDIKLTVVSRLDMISREGKYSRDSAFGYIVCQLTHVFKDYDSSTLSCEGLKLLLAELQWRELYGTSPYDSFTNIISHMGQYGASSDWYSEPELPPQVNAAVQEESRPEDDLSHNTEFIYAEKYFYATIDPIDSNGKIISKYSEPKNPDGPPEPDVRIRCHECNMLYESFDFSIHIIAHVENNRKEHERKEYSQRRLIECKHCFKTLPREQLPAHSSLLRAHYHLIKYGCRICCVRMADRSSFLQHMRRNHYESETPYHCPKCTYASSFQRDVFIHFQEEHRHALVVLCPLCLRSFTVAQPEVMTVAKMKELSRLVYSHISRHYTISKTYTCSNCCLCFLDKESLIDHQQKHHNPLISHIVSGTKLTQFIVTQEEQEHCVKALPMELFIANKRPNRTLDPAGSPTKVSKKKTKAAKAPQSRLVLSEPIESLRQDNQQQNGATSEMRDHYSNSEGEENDKASSDTDSEIYHSAHEDGVIHVRGLNQAAKFLDGGRPSLSVSKTRITGNKTRESTSSSKAVNAGQSEIAPDKDSCSSQRLIDYLSKMKRADGIVANHSVVLTPRGTPAKCCECQQYVTVDHFVAQIFCVSCKYLTHCPRAATRHNVATHRTHQTDHGRGNK